VGEGNRVIILRERVLMSPSILIVDDDTNLLIAFKRIFRKKFYRVQTACSIREAIECVSHSLPHVVILDFKLHNERGDDLLRMVKSRYPELPVVVITAFTDVFTRREAMEAGADGYFPKPFDPHELKATVHRLIDRRSGQAQDILLPNKPRSYF
jgi:DNA-binding response OmpR family regulator